MHKKIPRLPKVSQNNSCAGINSGCHPLQRETAWWGFVDATDISLIERTAVEGGWQVLKRFCWRGGLKIDYTWKYSFFHNCMWRLTQCQRNTVYFSMRQASPHWGTSNCLEYDSKWHWWGGALVSPLKSANSRRVPPHSLPWTTAEISIPYLLSSGCRDSKTNLIISLQGRKEQNKPSGHEE